MEWRLLDIILQSIAAFVGGWCFGYLRGKDNR